MSSVAQPYPHAAEGDEVEEVKERLRRSIRDARHARSPRRRDAAAQALADVVTAIPAVSEATCV
ncbi:5-formyltetrahydrofolate cyclo-ligase, partial [Cellulomonas septica]|nr:5-formyltetrahydrofolate cyclo-ligase [Cellulomonas septica]